MTVKKEQALLHAIWRGLDSCMSQHPALSLLPGAIKGASLLGDHKRWEHLDWGRGGRKQRGGEGLISQEHPELSL